MAVAVSFCAYSAEAVGICLVEDGKPSFAIVGRFAAEAAVRGPEGQPLAKARRNAVRRGADLLEKAFENCCGFKPIVLDEDDPQVSDIKYVIALGTTKWSEKLGVDPAKLPREGFELRTFDRGVVICGHDWMTVPDFYDVFNWRTSRLTCNGTEYGAQDFAERFLGVRYFSQYDPDLWNDFPKVRDLVLDPIAYRDHPRQWFRNGRANDGWRAATSSDFFGGEAPHPFDLAKAHPDRIEDIFFRDSHGTLWQDPEVYGKNFFDLTDTKFADILVDDFRTYYAQNGTGTYWKASHAPTSRYLWFGQCDRGLDLDTPRARRHRRQNAIMCDRTSEIYGHFYDYLARQCRTAFPGKTLVLMAYSTYLLAPRTIERFPDNVQILACAGQPALAWSDAHVDEVRRMYAGWNRLCASDKKCVPYLYLMSYKDVEPITAFIHGYCFGDFLKRVMPDVDAHHYYPCFGPFGKENPFGAYLMYHAAWNPDCDSEALMRDFLCRAFGKASGDKLIAACDLMLQRWKDHYIPGVAKGKYLGRNFRSIAQIEFDRLYRETFPAETIDVLEKFLDDAQAELGDDVRRHKRFAKVFDPIRKTLARARAFQRLKYPDFSAGRHPTVLPPFRKAFIGEPLEGPCPEAKFAWSDEGLTLTLRSPAPFADGKSLFDGDSFELMLAPGKEPSNLYQFVIASNGQYEDYHAQIDQPRGMDHNWVAKGVRHEVSRDGAGWSATLFIPWTALYDAPPNKGDVWKMNLISNRTSPAEYASISPTFRNNRFYDMYATVHFED